MDPAKILWKFSIFDNPYSVQMHGNADQNNSEYRHFLRNESDDSHLIAICDNTAKEFEALCGRKIEKSDVDTDTEWGDAEN